MSRGLLLPKHMAGARDTATATAIAKTAVHRMDSDDWATATVVSEQLGQLEEYLETRREEEPTYVLPQPTGWKIMMLMLTIPDKSAGGVIVLDESKEARALSSPQGVVLALGPQAYTDPARFDKPWLEIGYRATVIKYDASMFQLANGQRLGFVNDTQPVAVIDKGWEVPQ